jgi:hypothetical protein
MEAGAWRRVLETRFHPANQTLSTPVPPFRTILTATTL